jgi:hypothetical protein
MIEILIRPPASPALNMDETSWKLINHDVRTVADTRAERISCLFDGDSKTCVIAMRTVNAARKNRPFGSSPTGRQDVVRTNVDGPALEQSRKENCR